MRLHSVSDIFGLLRLTLTGARHDADIDPEHPSVLRVPVPIACSDHTYIVPWVEVMPMEGEPDVCIPTVRTGVQFSALQACLEGARAWVMTRYAPSGAAGEVTRLPRGVCVHVAQKADSCRLTLPIIAAILACAFDLPLRDEATGSGDVVPASGTLLPDTTYPRELYDIMQRVRISPLVLPASAAKVVRKVLPKPERKVRVLGVDSVLQFVKAMLDVERCDRTRLAALLGEEA